MPEERVSELEGISVKVKTYKTEKQREQRLKKTEYPRTAGQPQKV